MSMQWRDFQAMKNSNFWCQTDGDKSKSGFGLNGSRFVWRIKNFLDRTEQVGESVSSEVFRVIGSSDTVTKWVVHVFPKGHEDSEAGSISIQVVRNGRVKVKAKCDLWIINKTEEELDIIDEISSFEQKIDFVAKNVFLEDGFWLQDKDLTIICQIKVLETGYDVKRFQRIKMMHDLEIAFNSDDSIGFDAAVIKCGEVSFECNKFMLTARSPVFKGMFQAEMVESQTNLVNIDDIEPKVVAEMVEYIHTGIATNIGKYPRELLAAADRYQLVELKTSCEEILIASLDAKNCIDILLLSDLHNAQGLKTAALNFAAENMKSISSSCDWKKKLASVPSLLTDMIETFSTISDSLKKESEGLYSLLKETREMDA